MPRRLLPSNWFHRLPLGAREQPAWIFIGILMSFSGLAYLTGTAKSIITDAIGHNGIQVWGASLMLSGILLVVATVSGRAALEKLAHRMLISNMLAYMGWILVIIPFDRVASTVVLCGSLAALSEFRVLYLKALLKRTEIINHELNNRRG